ncbi:hypothetical protein GGS23DRAFT_12829 [Durotheca rogersii]|uniref:uncharacterized protein n=1 Tax=Durotheca rogersii TaxID=419775 RepID=UPI00221EB1D6|nr:uncharacterized protein GGS23DRAFT_12829 [Durotheca rogersii]KAI5868124.1 hypothetical protein GGS23DRAFT_12829 [Durotheca rogersii]
MMASDLTLLFPPIALLLILSSPVSLPLRPVGLFLSSSQHTRTIRIASSSTALFSYLRMCGWMYVCMYVCGARLRCPSTSGGVCVYVCVLCMWPGKLCPSALLITIWMALDTIEAMGSRTGWSKANK